MVGEVESLRLGGLQLQSRFFKALGDETRLRIVALLSHGELCVCHFESALGLSQPNASRQLGVLRSAGIVDSRREGSWVYYRLAPQLDEFCKQQLKALVAAEPDTFAGATPAGLAAVAVRPAAGLSRAAAREGGSSARASSAAAGISSSAARVARALAGPGAGPLRRPRGRRGAGCRGRA